MSEALSFRAGLYSLAVVGLCVLAIWGLMDGGPPSGMDGLGARIALTLRLLLLAAITMLDMCGWFGDWVGAEDFWLACGEQGAHVLG